MSVQVVRIRWMFGALLALVTVCAMAGMARAETTLPKEAGLPVNVDVGVAFVVLHNFDENQGTFRATVDLRLRWQDRRLHDPGANVGTPPQTFTGKAADEKMRNIWIAPVVFANQRGPAAASSQGLRLYPSGAVELIHRITADFDVDVDVGKFPFDRQKLRVDAKVDSLPLSLVALRFGQAELDFSRAARDVEVPGWSTGMVDLRSSPTAGWYNVPQARVMASLELKRQPGLLVASIFIPLLSSLLIPFLAIWLNRIEDGIFTSTPMR